MPTNKMLNDRLVEIPTDREVSYLQQRVSRRLAWAEVKATGLTSEVWK